MSRRKKVVDDKQDPQYPPWVFYLSFAIILVLFSTVAYFWPYASGKNPTMVVDNEIISIPAEVDRASPFIKEAYGHAIELPEVFEAVNCHCGCMRDEAHTSLKNCFLSKQEGYFSRHGIDCPICIAEARDVYKWYKYENDSIENISIRIDRKYGGKSMQIAESG